MKKRFKVNDVAKLFNISRQTLVYYDNIDLFKPSEVDGETSYRYYDEEQFFTLHFILTLKKAGFTLKEIKGYISTKSAEEGLTFLEERNREVEERLEALRETSRIIKTKIKETRKVIEGDSIPKVVEISFGRALLVDIDLNEHSLQESQVSDEIIAFRRYHEIVDDILEAKKNNGITDNKIINIMDRNNTSLTGVKKAGFFIPKGVKTIEGEVEIASNFYATLSHRGPWNEVEESYNKLISFIKGNDYIIVGDFIEVFNNINVYLGSGEGGKIDLYIPIEKINKKHRYFNEK